MKNKLVVSLAILMGILVLVVLAFQFLINPVENVTERSGKFFDNTGKQLGYCTVKTELRKLDTVSGTHTTFYFNSDQSSMGYCQGDSTGSYVNLKSQPNICKPVTLQGECDPTVHPKENGFCSKAKYTCVLDK